MASEADLLACVRICGGQYGANSFTVDEFAAELKCSVSTARRRLNALHDSRLVFCYDKASNRLLWEVSWYALQEYHPELFQRAQTEIQMLSVDDLRYGL